jgi:O-antigen ligase
VTGDPNYFSISALLCAPIAFYLLGTRQPRWERYFCIGSLFLILVALTLAASRGALLGIVTASTLMVWRSPRRLRSLLLAGSLLVPLMVFTPASPLDRLLNPTQGDQQSSDFRTLLFDAGLRMLTEHPLRGVGIGNFKPFVKLFSTEELEMLAHNSYVEVAAELGIPGLFLFLAILFSTLRTLRRVHRDRKLSPPLLRQAALGLETGLLATCVSLFFLSAYNQKLFWLFILLSMCLSSLSKAISEPAKAEPEETLGG